jgi:hypothetical protein
MGELVTRCRLQIMTMAQSFRGYVRGMQWNAFLAVRETEKIKIIPAADAGRVIPVLTAGQILTAPHPQLIGGRGAIKW